MEEQVLILHDTTAMQFNGDRQGLGRLQTSAKGFFLHASLAVRLDRSPLGVLGANAWVRPEQGRRNRNQRQMRKAPERESLRWWRGIARCEELLDAAGRAVHVMDREGDNCDLVAQLSDRVRRRRLPSPVDGRGIFQGAQDRVSIREASALKPSFLDQCARPVPSDRCTVARATKRCACSADVWWPPAKQRPTGLDGPWSSSRTPLGARARLD